MSESTRMLLGLALGIIVMILLVMKTKVHSFMALLIAAMITGIIGGMPISDVTLADGTTQTGLITAIQDGFGSTLKSTGIIIGLGVMMGGVLENPALLKNGIQLHQTHWPEKRRMGAGNYRMVYFNSGICRFRNRDLCPSL